MILIYIASTKKIEKNPFKKVIVLMMENHSYDNMVLIYFI